MGKIGDLWVKLGLKKDEFDKGMKEAGTQAEGFGGKIKGLVNTTKLAYAAIGAAVLKAADSFAHTSQKFGDAWDNTMAGMKGAWNSFLNTITSWDWDNFGQKIADSFNAAKESAKAHDLETEVMNSIKLKKAQIGEELALLEIEMRDTSKSYEERAAAAQKYLDKVKPLYDQEIALRKKIMLADVDEYLTNAGITDINQSKREAVQRFITDVAPNTELFDALKEWNNKVTGKKFKLTQRQTDILRDFFSTDDWNKDVAGALAAYYDSSNDKRTNKVMDSLLKAYDARKAYDSETRKVQGIGNNASGKVTASLSKATEEWSAEMSYLLGHAQEQIENGIFDIVERIDNAIPEVNDSMKRFAEAMNEPLIAGFKEQQEKIEENAEKMRTQFERIQEAGATLSDGLKQGAVNGLEVLAEAMGTGNIDGAQVARALIEPLADGAIKAGLIISGFSDAVIAWKNSLSNPYAGVIAGAALVAVGVAAKAGLAAITSGKGASSGNGYATTGNAYMSNINYQNELTVYVKGTIKGSDILLSGSGTQNKWNR